MNKEFSKRKSTRIKNYDYSTEGAYFVTICIRDRMQILSDVVKTEPDTLDDVICAFKSLSSRACKKQLGIERMFQRSSAEHIVRDIYDYETRRKYIYENPMRWYYKNKE